MADKKEASRQNAKSNMSPDNATDSVGNESANNEAIDYS